MTSLATGPAPAEVRDRSRALKRVVERQVLPRLALRMPALVRPERFGDGLSDEVKGMTSLALSADLDASRRVLARLYEAGASFTALQLGLLAPAARRLDGLWRSDEVTFVDVTLATGNLQRMMRFVAIDLAAGSGRGPLPHAILLGPAPGESHGFGAAMAGEFFRRDGWQVCLEPRGTEAALVEQLSRAWYDVLGLSVVCRPDVAALAAALARLRAASRNPDLLVIAGGEAMTADPSLVDLIGADATLAALPAAPARAHRLVAALVGARGARAAG